MKTKDEENRRRILVDSPKTLQTYLRDPKRISEIITHMFIMEEYRDNFKDRDL